IDTNDARLFFLGIRNPKKSKIDFYKKAFAVKDKAKVTVTIKLSADDRAYLEENFANGMFVDGFVYLNGKIDLSIPFLAFYGNWGDSSMFEPFDLIRYYHGSEDEWLYTLDIEENEFTNYFLTRTAGDSRKYYFLGNDYADDDEYIADRNAMKSDGSTEFYAAVLTLIRNAADLKLEVKNAETGEVYYSLDKGAVEAAFFYQPTMTWEGNRTQLPIGWKGTDAQGKPLADGTKVNITVTALPSYYLDESRVPGKGVTWTLPLTIDNQAPLAEVKDTGVRTDEQGNEIGTLSVDVLDDNYVAAVLVLDRSKSKILGRYAVNQTEPYSISEVTVDYPQSVFYVDVIDYAGNESLYRVNMSGNPDTNYAETISVSDEEVVLLKGNSYKVSAVVGPDTLVDDSVIWLSDDETVATVDENGIITGVADGETIVYAIANAPAADGSMVYAEIYVEVFSIPQQLEGFIWDTTNRPSFATFNTATLPEYEMLSDSFPQDFWSAAVVGDKIYASTQSDDQSDASLYAIDPANGFSTELVADGTTWFTDMAYSESTEYIYSTYGPFIMRSTTDGALSGYIDMRDYTDAYMVGVAYSFTTRYQRNPADWIYVIDEDGVIWQLLWVTNGMYGIMDASETGVTTEGGWYFDSLYITEDELVFYSLYDGSGASTMYLLFEEYDSAEGVSTFTPFELGRFEDGIWPVSGLLEWGGEIGNGAQTGSIDRVDQTLKTDLDNVTLYQQLEANDFSEIETLTREIIVK
ncbi:MAG: Ig-like domain-containing protein, partial [Lachnospiraceae bacterium]|nr:Ig-like domain-containing protein [Lachnospiraceae bacterium]